MRRSLRIWAWSAVLIWAFAGCSNDSGSSDSGQEEEQKCDCSTGEHCSSEEQAQCEMKCPDECPELCDSTGKCPEDGCPKDCTNGCDANGQCKADCPEECTNGCDEHGQCKVECPEECTNGCDEHGQCKVECPEECTNGCDEHGQCKADCPENCANGCDEHGQCKADCPENCSNGCDENGQCLVVCPDDCANGCDDGKCRCSESCRTSCDEKGACQCSEACPESCGEDGACACSETCQSSCDVNGVCQCPESCPDQCNENGVCITKCGDGQIESIWFSYNELDLLAPGSTGRTTYSMTLNFKIGDKTYTLEDLPCKDDVILETQDPSIVTVAKNDTNPKTPTFTAVAPGTTTCIVSIKDQPGVTGQLKLHVLNLDALHGDVTESVDGKFPHLLKTPIVLLGYSQGFDFYDENMQYFTRLSAPSPNYTYIKDGKTGSIKYTISNSNDMVFKHDGKSNSKAMTFYNAGHGQNMNVEHTEDQDYIWFSNFNSLYCSKKSDTEQTCSASVYHSQTISRVPWQEEASFYPNQLPENYYYTGKDNEYHFFLEPALDTKNNKFAFKSKMCALDLYLNNPVEYGKCIANSMETVRIYNLSSVKALKTKQVTFPRPLTYLDSSGSLNTGDVSATVKDLSELKPIHEFSVKSLPIQGTEIENGILYMVAQVPYLLEKKEGKEGQYSYRSLIPIFVYTYDGVSIGGKTAIKDQTINGNGKDEYAYFLGPGKKDKVFVDVTQNSSCGKTNCHGDDNRYCECERYFMDNEQLDALFKYTEIDETGEYEMQPTGFYEPEGIRANDGKLYVHLMVGYTRKSKDGTSKGATRQATLVYDLTK